MLFYILASSKEWHYLLCILIPLSYILLRNRKFMLVWCFIQTSHNHYSVRWCITIPRIFQESERVIMRIKENATNTYYEVIMAAIPPTPCKGIYLNQFVVRADMEDAIVLSCNHCVIYSLCENLKHTKYLSIN